MARLPLIGLAVASAFSLPLSALGAEPFTWSDFIGSIPREKAAPFPADLQLRAGLEAIKRNNFAEASRWFNSAIRKVPENSHLHFLNGLAYHFQFASGNQSSRDLAETAYKLTLRLAPDHALAAQHLGALLLENRRYGEAQAAFAHSLLIENNNPAAWHSLAVASYYQRDPGLALWAITKAEAMLPADPAILRTATLINAAAGRPQAAQKRLEQFQATHDVQGKEMLSRRVQQWSQFNAQRDAGLIKTIDTVPLMPAPPQPSPPSSPAEFAQPVIPFQANQTAQPNTLLRNWSDCPQGGQSQSSSNYGYSGSNTNDETAQLSALPSPCDAANLPRMVLLDSAIITTEENLTTTKGINLLDSLKLVHTATFSYTSDPGSSSRNYHYLTRNAALTNQTGDSLSATSALIYSLNIANADERRNEVLARPTLIALDRQPSTFFSGSNLATALQGSFSSPTLVQHPTGISVSVTPTFIDADTLLLAVKVARSYITGSGQDINGGTVASSRNTASANVMMKMGDTLIISGLTERQNSEQENGVPLLKDIPVVQYLFNQETKTDFTRSVLVTITPRSAAPNSLRPLPPDANRSRELGSHELKELKEEARRALASVPNLDVTQFDMEDNRLYREFRSSDLKAEDWRRPPFLERTLKQIVDFIYY